MAATKQAAAPSGHKLTLKQEKFCLVYLETGNASEAYRQAYDVDRMKPETIKRKAAELMVNGNITATIEAAQSDARERSHLTVESLLAELEEARQAAMTADTPQSSAAVSATMGKAKLLGLDKQIIEHSGPGGGPIQTKSDNVDLSILSDSAIAELMAARGKEK